MFKLQGQVRLFSLIVLPAFLVGCGLAPAANQPGSTEDLSRAIPPATREDQTKSQPATVDQTAMENQPAGELVLAAPRDMAPGETDPYYVHPMLRVWESLVVTDNDWVPQPYLAESWEQAEDGLSWTFKLRRDVVFSDGSPFNADVVIANVERNRKISPRPSPFYAFNAEAAYGDLAGVEELDAYTVRFVHNRVEPSFPAMLANFYSAMFAPASFTEEGDFTGPPIASGPFKVVERVPDQYVLLNANPNYWGEPPGVQRVLVRTIPDPETRAAALRAGEIQGVMDLGAIQPITAQELALTGEFQVSSAVIPITHYIFVNGTKAPWNDRRLRQALSLAVDRNFIVNNIFLGYGVPAGSMLSAVVRQWHDDTITPAYNLEQARMLAQEVLGTERRPALLLIPSYQLERYPYRALGEYVQAQLVHIGIDAEIRILEGGAFNETTAAGAYDLALRIQGLANSEPAFLFANYLACNGDQNRRMSLGYCNPEVEALLEQLQTETNAERRAEMYSTLQAIAARDLPVIPLMYEKGVVVSSTQLAGYEIGTNYWITLDKVWLR